MQLQANNNKKEKVCQAARTVNSPTKLATLDKKTDNSTRYNTEKRELFEDYK